jgi:hypothetical protein
MGNEREGGGLPEVVEAHWALKNVAAKLPLSMTGGTI